MQAGTQADKEALTTWLSMLQDGPSCLLLQE